MTTVALVRSVEPFTPPSRAARGSILDIAEVTSGVSTGLGLDGLIESFNCIGVDVDAINCAGFKGLTKRFDPPSFSNGVMFNIQSGVRCKGFGFDRNDPKIKSAFDSMEPEGVSIGLHDTLLVNGTDITPAAGTITPAQALGLLEGAGYSGYAGQPVIHVGPMLASLWAAVQAVRLVGDHLETHLGTPVAVSTGNESKTAGKLDPDQWAFVTGAVALIRSEAVLASDIDRATNEQTVLYERLYVAAIDCLVAKVKVKVL
jgi:hypothetical protein